MIEHIKSHVKDIFAPYKGVKEAYELKQELEQNLIEKYHDYKNQGYKNDVAYEKTIDSIGNIEELVENFDPDYSEQRENLYGVFSNGIMGAGVYAILFVALMIVFEGNLTRDVIVMPAVILFTIISMIQFIVKGNARFPRWLVLGSFTASVITAIIMTVLSR